MTLTVHTEEGEQRELTLKVEVAESRVEKAMRKKARELSHEIRMPGFRKGKAPYHVLLRRIGRDVVRAEAVEDLIQPVFEEAVIESGAEIYAPPSLDNLTAEPLVLTFTVPLEPVITLGDYRTLRREVEEVAISDEAVEQALEQIQHKHQETEAVERPIEAGDLVAISGKGELLPKADEGDDGDAEGEDGETAVSSDDNVLFDQEHLPLIMDSEKLFAGTDFVKNMLGLSAGDDTEFEIDIPEDYDEEDMAGRKATFNLSILDIQSRTVPPIDDELAKLEGKFETLEELRQDLQENLQKEAESKAESDLLEQMTTDLLKDAELVYPPAAIDQEVESMVGEFKEQVKRSGWELDDFLKMQGQDENDLRKNFRENGEERLKRRLVLRQLIVDELITIDEADIDTAVEARLAGYESEELRDGMRGFFKTNMFDTLSSEILSEKVNTRIKEILSGEAPDLETLAAEAEAKAQAAIEAAEATGEEE